MAKDKARTGPEKLKNWCMKQKPPWGREFLASVIGLQYGTVSNLLSATRDQRPSYLTAKTIEILTNGEITVDEMMISPAELGEIEQRIADQWPEFHKN